MILFKKLRYQNILSTGNVFTEIDLTKSRTSLIVGENGAGKTTLIDAICFVLFGKPFRNINKPQLVNSITQKNLLVEIEFSIGRKQYLVRRGIKPNVFEIFLDGTLINQNAGMVDYQEVLERNILKMNFKSFKQIVVLGSTNYVPFMQLSAADRRKVISDLLDIEIFNVMADIAKKRVSENKSAIKDAEHEIELVEQKIDLTRKHIQSLKTNNQELIDRKKELIEETNEKISSISHDISLLNTQVSELSELTEDFDKLTRKKHKLIDLETQFEAKIRQVRKEVEFFGDHDNCPTCKQGIDHDFKHERIEKKNNQLDELDSKLNQLRTDISALESNLSEMIKVSSKISDLNKDIQDKNSELRALNSNVEYWKQEIDSLKNNNSQLDGSVEDIRMFKQQRDEHIDNKIKLYNEKELLDVASNLLKDGGIRTRIIRQFIPIINKLINKYLAALDFFVNFELDEQFNETIKSRHRDEFSYDSFSEGEKFRIDISLMLTWRAIAKLRNSASTNLLIMDEVFDSSLDNSGIEEFLKVLDTVSGESNVFVISHKGDALFDRFESILKFEKQGNFSKLIV